MTAQPEAAQLLTVPEAAALLRLHPETVRRLLRAGRLPGINRGYSWRLPRDELEKYLDAHRNGPPE